MLMWSSIAFLACSLSALLAFVDASSSLALDGGGYILSSPTNGYFELDLTHSGTTHLQIAQWKGDSMIGLLTIPGGHALVSEDHDVLLVTRNTRDSINLLLRRAELKYRCQYDGWGNFLFRFTLYTDMFVAIDVTNCFEERFTPADANRAATVLSLIPAGSRPSR